MKKRALVFYSNGGNGHQTATDALCGILNDTQQIEAIAVSSFSNQLSSRDPVKALSGGKMDSDKLYNYCLKNEIKTALWLITRFGYYYYYFVQKSIERTLYSEVRKMKPDMIISTIPVLNFFYARIAKKLKIPLVIYPTDFDVELFLFLIPQKRIYDQMYFVQTHPKIKLRGNIEKHIHKENILSLPFPVRKAFFKSEDKDKLKESFGLNPSIKTVLLMFGGQGSIQQYEFVKQILGLQLPINLVVASGKNTEMHELTSWIRPEDKHPTRLYNLGYLNENEMAQWMKAADILVTKPGGSTVNEALFSQTFMALSENKTIKWENYNACELERIGAAKTFKNIHDLKKIIEQETLPKIEKLNQDQETIKTAFVKLVSDSNQPQIQS